MTNTNMVTPPSAAQFAAFSAVVQQKLWPAIKDRISGEELQRNYIQGPNGPENVLTRLRDGLTGSRESNLILPASPFFANEEVASTRVYPVTYVPKPVCEQMVEWSKHFPNLNAEQMLACSKDMPGLPIGAEWHFVIPKPERIAKNYHEALEKILDVIGKTRTFTNWRKGELGPKRLKLTERTAAGLAALSAGYEGDFFLLPAQFGLTYRGKSVRRVRVLYTPAEFGLGPYEAGAMLVTHPERLRSNSDLFVDCPGAEYDYEGDGSFLYAPCLGFSGGGLRFYACRVSRFGGGCGGASAFLPQ